MYYFLGSDATWDSMQILSRITCRLLPGALKEQALRFSEMCLCLAVCYFLHSPKFSDRLCAPPSPLSIGMVVSFCWDKAAEALTS